MGSSNNKNDIRFYDEARGIASVSCGYVNVNSIIPLPLLPPLLPTSMRVCIIYNFPKQTLEQIGTTNMEYKTADLCDEFSDQISIITPDPLQNFGGKTQFCGAIATVECFEDNSFVRKSLEAEGAGKVLVVDGGASMQCALLGDMLAELAVKNGWAGIIVNGCIRDADIIATLPIGVKALAATPLKSVKKDVGKQNVNVEFCSVCFIPGHWIYADGDGIIVSPSKLK